MRTIITILLTIALSIQVTVVLAGKKKDHLSDTDDSDATVCDDKIKTCKADIVNIVNKLKSANEELLYFKGTDGFLAAFSLHTAEREIEDLIHRARYDCCAIPRELTEAETKDILDEKEPLVAEIRLILTTILSKKPQLEHVLLACSLLRNDLRNIQALVRPLTTCLAERADKDHKDDVNRAAAELDGLFSSAIRAI
ncbi:hypothetical protein BDF20DRAFT_1001707 [Mycotypha africana]|uniref:uncharacterized protein n=1 Tax=Mycotypha africana TaxID=64632 RepID=UPI0022FFC7EE|nr:uncharacterized protein BDF20DRAFT_1001707 [Mycotypha africana]KAI8975130.1 hypothetical protein BDF20DRAFT_1001707 [Mycotypha africana]